MNISTVVRLDSLGRLVIPKKIRDYLDIDVEDKVDLSFDGVTITITKRNMTEIDNYINQITDMAMDSRSITVTEYDNLCKTLEKLRCVK